MKQKGIFSRLALVLLCLLFYGGLWAQDFTQLPPFKKANSIWMLATKGISFNTSPATMLPSSMPMGTMGNVSVCHPRTGQLLFYTNGFNCWNRNHQLMPDGIGLGGAGLSMQNICIVPFINDTSKYYLFYIKQGGISLSIGGGPLPTLPPGGFDYNLTYSVIDMNLDNGLGAIVPGKRNIIAAHGPLGDMMAVVPGNNCDIWLLTHPVDLPDVKAFHITTAGIDTTPVVSTLMPGITGLQSFTAGALAVSPNRKKVAMASNNGLEISGFGFGFYGTIGVQVADFDPETGILSNNMVLTDTSMAEGVCFSPDNSKLYSALITGMIDSSNCGYLCQHDLSSGVPTSIIASRYLIPYTGGSLRRRGDTVFLSAFRGYFSRPNLAGAACGFAPSVTTPFLPAGYPLGDLCYPIGNDVVYTFPPDTLTLPMTDTCFFRKITLHAPAGYNDYVWNDGVADSMHNFYSSGQCKVTYNDGCHTYIKPYRLNEAGAGLGPRDTVICKAPPLVLQAGTKGQVQSFLWQDGSTGNSFRVTQDGQYWVKVTFAANCTLTDTIGITFSDVQQDLGEDKIICRGDPVNVTLKANIPPGGNASWNTGATGQTITATDTGTYSVKVTAGKCVGRDEVHIGMGYCACQPLVPNAFSPNADGVNDWFKPVLAADCPVSNYSLAVYNRFGQRVFFSAKPEQGWDGQFNGQPSEVGTYMYELKYTGGVRNISEYKKGDLNLIR
ncbi:gliding motility-associated C-terminal domain-containing protein [Taibaiella koreensis]|uniref:gliding motility-associated C-terminal domain-containing protein n=1 Tax=Taibaiella koreensis TaxID=1268548 RepID=UPI000E5A0860|nr:gliding motility-associated C-terminal domain-containing protein [Taibaiella koreensis]